MSLEARLSSVLRNATPEPEQLESGDAGADGCPDAVERRAGEVADLVGHVVLALRRAALPGARTAGYRPGTARLPTTGAPRSRTILDVTR